MKSAKTIGKAVVIIALAMVGFFCLFCELEEGRYEGWRWAMAFVCTKAFGIMCLAAFFALIEPAWRPARQ